MPIEKGAKSIHSSSDSSASDCSSDALSDDSLINRQILDTQCGADVKIPQKEAPEATIWSQTQAEPLLNDSFAFYGSHLKVSQHDRLHVMEHELFQYYEGRLRHEQEGRELAHSGKEYLISKFEEMKLENDKMKQLNSEMNDAMAKNIRDCREAIIDARRLCRLHCNDKLRRMHYL